MFVSPLTEDVRSVLLSGAIIKFKAANQNTAVSMFPEIAIARLMSPAVAVEVGRQNVMR